MRPSKTRYYSQRSAGGARTLEACYYLDPEIYQVESERIFGRNWLYLGPAASWTEGGSYQLHEVDREQLIIVRDESGQFHAHFNLCRHRGTRLCETPEGRFNHSIQCPYHGWTYALDGRLMGAPHMGKDFDKTSYPLKQAHLDAWEGLIFLNLAAQPVPLPAALSSVWDKFTAWRLPHLRVVHETVYLVAANWKLLFQNYSECYHCPTLHPHLNRLTPFRNSANDLESGPILGGPMQLSDGVQSMALGGLRCAPLLSPEIDPSLVYYYTIFPNFLLSLFPDYAMVHRLDRISPSQTRITCQWLFAPEALEAEGFDPLPAVEFWDLTNRQDWHICELAQQGIASRAYSPGPYSDLESMLAAFDREYLAALG